MMIHAYLTNGFFPWAKIFLESLKYHHGEKMFVVLSTRELDRAKIKELYSFYDNLEVIDKGFDFDKMAKKARVSKKVLLSFKKQVETSHVTPKNNVWKTIIADDDRIKEILEVMKTYMNQRYMIHFDVDMYFKKPISELIQIVKTNDISIRLRLQSKLNRRTMIGVQGYKLSDLTINFVEDWIKNIEKVPPHKRALGHGQGACYHSYMKFKDRVSWGMIYPRFISPRMQQTDVVWSGNTKQGKEKMIALFNKDFEKMKK